MKLTVLSAIAALASLCLPALPVNAAPSDCWMGDTRESRDLKYVACDVTSRRNANNHMVHDVSLLNGRIKYTAVLWYYKETPGKGIAEVIYKGKVTESDYLIDQDGDVQIHGSKGHVMAFRLPDAGRPPTTVRPSGRPRPQPSDSYGDAIHEALFR